MSFLFVPGMLFGSRHFWWRKGACRKSAHEGLDIAMYIGKGGRVGSLGSGLVVPPAFPGRVIRIMDDFLGSTVLLEACLYDKRYYFFYAHINPLPEIKPGVDIKPGAPLGRVADPAIAGKKVPPHLHVSVASAEALPEPDLLEWELINKIGINSFIDPIWMIQFDYELADRLPGIRW